MMNLSKFINQHVDITLRNGCTMTDVLVAPNPYSYRSGFIYPFLIVQEGIFINAYTRDGMLRIFSEDSRDIIKIQSHSNSDFKLNCKMKIKRLDVPGWVTFEKLYYECVGDTRTELKENETIDEYYIRMMKFEGYNQCELYFPSDGYYLVDNNKVVIIFDGKAYSNVSDASVRRFKEDFEFVDAPSLSLEVMNSLKCLIHQGLINYKDKLHQLYSVNLLRNNQKKDILKHRMSLKMLNR